MSNDDQRHVILSSGPVTGFFVVMATVALLMSLIAPGVQKSREAARRTQSKNHLKQIGLALHNYHDTFQMHPPGGVFDDSGKAFHGWTTFLTPYLEDSPFYNSLDFKIPWDDPQQIERFRPGYGQVFLNLSVAQQYDADGLAVTHFAGNDLVLYRNSSTKLSDLIQGTSNTFLCGDAKGDFEPWGAPYNWRSVELGLNQSDQGFGCAVRDVTQMLMADGAVKEFHHASDPVIFTTLRGRNAQWDKVPGDVTKPARR